MKGIKRSLSISILALAAVLMMSCENSSQPSEKEAEPDSGGQSRPAPWAAPVKDRPGLPNLFKVTDGLYRGAQPEKEGFAQLRSMGIKTVVNLRSLHSDRKECRKHGLGYVKISVQAWEAEDEEVVLFLDTVADPDRRPVFVHCQHGADRTGMMVAIYRIIEQGWSREDAIREMTEGGFGFHEIWQNLITYIRELDVDAIQRLRGKI